MSRQPCDDCGSSDGLQINDWGTYCHSCGKTYRSRAWEGQTQKTADRLDLYWDEFRSPEITKYLARYWVSEALADQYKIGSWGSDRFVLPYYYPDGKIKWVYAKYIVADKQPRHFMKGDKSIMCSHEEELETDTIVIVEDAISLMRVGEVTPCRALMTARADAKDFEFTSPDQRILVWLDGDKAGRDGAKHIAKSLQLNYPNVSIVESEKDPKCYRKQTIEEVICPT